MTGFADSAIHSSAEIHVRLEHRLLIDSAWVVDNGLNSVALQCGDELVARALELIE